MKRPSRRALLLGLVPFVAVCFSVPAWDRIHPMVFGVPFNLFWLLLWTILTPLCMWLAYQTETSSRNGSTSAHPDKEQQR